MRKLLTALSALLALAIGVDFVLWRNAAAQLDAAYQAWRDQARAAGWAVDSGQPSKGGWPLAATLSLPHPRVQGGGTWLPGGLDWQAEQLVLSVSLADPAMLDVTPYGAQSWRIGALPPATVTARNATLSVPLRDAGGANLLAKDVQMALPAGNADLGDVTFHVGWGDVPSVSLRIEAVNLPAAGWAPGHPWPLGPRLSSVSLDATLANGLPDGGDLAARVANWRDRGSIVHVQRLALGWGALGLSLSGDVGLDAGLQPNGTAALHVLGAGATLDALADADLISRSEAMAAKAVAALLARSPDGGLPAVDAPATLENGVVTVAGIPLARVPAIAWQK